MAGRVARRFTDRRGGKRLLVQRGAQMAEAFVHTSGRTLCEHHGRSPNAWRLRHDQKQPVACVKEFARVSTADLESPISGSRCPPGASGGHRLRARLAVRLVVVAVEGVLRLLPDVPSLFLCLAQGFLQLALALLGLALGLVSVTVGADLLLRITQVSWTCPRPASASFDAIVVHFASSSGVWGALDSLCGRARNRSVAKLARRRLGTRLGREAV